MDVRVAAVPLDELRRCDAPGEILSWDPEPAVRAGSVGVDHRIDATAQLIDLKIGTDCHVAIEPDSGRSRCWRVLRIERIDS